MSTRYEWMEASVASVEFVPDGYDVRRGVRADDYTDDADMVDEGGALLLGVDEVTVIAGTPDEIRALLMRALALLPRPEFAYYCAYGCSYGSDSQVAIAEHYESRHRDEELP